VCVCTDCCVCSHHLLRIRDHPHSTCLCA
jgi:hypothetical protein